MDPAEIRMKSSQLAEDLAWLEGHAGSKPGQEQARYLLRLTAALVRNVVGPALEGQSPLPLHVVVVGGAGAGKSTMANLLMGEMRAESNPQAGFTRHPIGFLKDDARLAWPATLGFLGPLRRLDRSESARLDEDVYQVRRLRADQPEHVLLDRFVVWDCPDMTTWAAGHYVSRLLEVAGLADVLVYVASDERYNDEVPTEFLKLFLAAGKSVVVVLCKMREADMPAFLAHFEKEVGAKLPKPPVALLGIPQLTSDELRDPIHAAARWRIPLLNQISVLGDPPETSRQRTLAAALHHLKHDQSRFLAVAQQDVAALDTWQRLVQEGQAEFEKRYRKEYLTSERFRRFDETLVKLLELLELPKIGQVLSKTLSVLRMPYTLIRGWFRREPAVPETPTMMERPVLDAAMRAWLDQLRKEAAYRRDEHGLFQHVHEGFRQGMGEKCEKRFDELARAFHNSLTEEVDRTARAILHDLEKSPTALNTLRGTKFALDISAVIGGLALGGLTPISVLLVPLAASVSQYLVDLLGENYVSYRREETRSRQQTLFSQQLSQPLADWLRDWPTTGGSNYERLQIILKRLPENVEFLEKAVKSTPLAAS